MIIGTAGHIDHGKTSLVKSLTGVDADRLKEEQARGITVDLGFAYQARPSGGVLGFVDVPGHERLVRNMLAGITGIDHVMLVVAADDGPMPQTREHLAIIDLLGLKQGVVALTKCDLVGADRLAEVQAQVRHMLMGTSLADAPILPLSNLTGEGMQSLRDHLECAANELDAHADERRSGHFRLAVDRSFSLVGIGTVVTGTVASGEVRVGDHLLLSPRGTEVRVRSVHAQNRPAERGSAGQRLALNLAGVDKQAVLRGDWLVAPAANAPTRLIDARLRVLSSEAKALAHWTPLHLHLGAEDVGARVVMLEGRSIAAGQDALVQLELDRPIGAWHGDRFIVRDQSALRTIGGGSVLDVFAPNTRRRKAERVAAGRALEHDDAAAALSALLALQQPNGVNWRQYATLWNLPPAPAAALLASVPHRALEGDPSILLFAPGQVEALTDKVSAVLRTHHAKLADSPGLSSAQLMRALKEKPSTAVFSRLLQALLKQGTLERGGPHLRLAGHVASLQGVEKQVWERIKPWLDEGGSQAPKLSEMLLRDRTLRRDQVLRVLERLERMGQVFAVGAEYYIQTRHLLELARISKRLAEQDANQRLNVKDLREATGMNRHLSVPLVEFFDKVGFTKRDELGRHIRRDPDKLFGDTA